jgi:hypothetical protein
MALLSRLKGLFQLNRLQCDLDDELRSHLEMRTRDNLAAGMPPDEARCDAQRRFGNSTLLKEDTRATDIVGWLETAAQNLRYGARMPRRNLASLSSPFSLSASAPTSPSYRRSRRPSSAPALSTSRATRSRLRRHAQLEHSRRRHVRPRAFGLVHIHTRRLNENHPAIAGHAAQPPEIEKMDCLRDRPDLLYRWIAHYCPLDAPEPSEGRQQSRL